jgi:hypothetical protein
VAVVAVNKTMLQVVVLVLVVLVVGVQVQTTVGQRLVVQELQTLVAVAVAVQTCQEILVAETVALASYHSLRNRTECIGGNMGHYAKVINGYSY